MDSAYYRKFSVIDMYMKHKTLDILKYISSAAQHDKELTDITKPTDMYPKMTAL